MAKKKNSISINALEKHCKLTTPDTYYGKFDAGNGESVEFEVKYRLSLEECMRFIEDVVNECVREKDLLYIPLAYEFIFNKNVLTYYANFTMPADMNKAFDLVMGAQDLIEAVMSHIDRHQCGMIQRAIAERVNFEKSKMVTLQEIKLNEMMSEMNQFISRMSGLFEGVDGEQMAKFVSGMAQAPQVTAEDLANAMVGSVSKPE